MRFGREDDDDDDDDEGIGFLGSRWKKMGGEIKGGA